MAIYVAASHKTMPNIKARKAFTVSMATAKYIKAIDYLGVTSGNKVADKFAKSGLTAIKSENVDAPLIAELPLALECKMVNYDEESELLLGEIVNVTADESALDAEGKLSAETPISIEYLTNQNTGHVAVAESMQQDFSAVGIKMTIQVQDWNVFLEERKSGNFDIAREGWIADFNDPINMLEMWISTSGNNDCQFGR